MENPQEDMKRAECCASYVKTFQKGKTGIKQMNRLAAIYEDSNKFEVGHVVETRPTRNCEEIGTRKFPPAVEDYGLDERKWKLQSW
jgi:hypothetical protein